MMTCTFYEIYCKCGLGMALNNNALVIRFILVYF